MFKGINKRSFFYLTFTPHNASLLLNIGRIILIPKNTPVIVKCFFDLNPGILKNIQPSSSAIAPRMGSRTQCRLHSSFFIPYPHPHVLQHTAQWTEDGVIEGQGWSPAGLKALTLDVP